MHEDPTRMMGQPDDPSTEPHGNMRLLDRRPDRGDRRPGRSRSS